MSKHKKQMNMTSLKELKRKLYEYDGQFRIFYIITRNKKEYE